MNRTNRRGITLLETQLVIVAGLAIAMFAVTTISALMLAGGRMQESVADTQTLARLTQQFRSDVHAAQAAFAGDADDPQSAALLLLLPDDIKLEYTLTGHGLLRRELHAGQRVRSEEYRLATYRAALPEFDEASQSLTLQVQEVTSIGEIGEHGFPVRAVLGRHSRLLEESP